MTRLAIVGLGLVGRRHLDAAGALDEVELVAAADPSEAARRHARERGVPAFDSLEALLDGARPDAVVLATPTPLHASQALACVARAVPALVEKPLAVTAAEAAALVRASETAGVPLLVGHHRRHNPLVREAKARIESGALGEIRTVQSTCWFHKPDEYFAEAPWRARRGAGPISVNLVHDVDLVRHLCGEVREVRAVAAPSPRGHENEASAAAVLAFEGGAIGTVSVSDAVAAPWSWELTSGEYPVYARTAESCLLIGGSRGSLSVPDLRLWRHEGRPDWWAPISATASPRPSADPLVEQLRHFAAVARGETAPRVSAREGFVTLCTIEAIERAAGSGEAVSVADVARRAEAGGVDSVVPDP